MNQLNPDKPVPLPRSYGVFGHAAAAHLTYYRTARLSNTRQEGSGIVTSEFDTDTEAIPLPHAQSLRPCGRRVPRPFTAHRGAPRRRRIGTTATLLPVPLTRGEHSALHRPL